MAPMTLELRSPHQRRSDQLSILTKRQPPPQSPGRFLKTFNDTAVLTKFDPEFDSDADTEGPASGSSVWRRDLSRVLSNSSGPASSDFSMYHLVSERNSKQAVDTPSTENPESPDMQHLPKHFSQQRDESEDGAATPLASFSRERASSFYGSRDHDKSGELSADNLGPVSASQLRKVLDEDYDLYFSGTRKDDSCGEVSISPTTTTQQSESPPDSAPVSPREKPNRLRSAKSAPQSQKPRDLAKWTADTDSPRVESSGALGMHKSLLGPNEFTISILSEDSIELRDTVELPPDELTTLLSGSLERPRLSSGAIPLFVEEVGRVPRAAIIDGRIERVKVMKKNSITVHVKSKSAESAVGCTARSLSRCLRNKADEEERHVERKKRRRKRKKRKGRGSQRLPTMVASAGRSTEK